MGKLRFTIILAIIMSLLVFVFCGCKPEQVTNANKKLMYASWTDVKIYTIEGRVDIENARESPVHFVKKTVQGQYGEQTVWIEPLGMVLHDSKLSTSNHTSCCYLLNRGGNAIDFYRLKQGDF